VGSGTIVLVGVGVSVRVGNEAGVEDEHATRSAIANTGKKRL
jgi:hypothetical protein